MRIYTKDLIYFMAGIVFLLIFIGPAIYWNGYLLLTTWIPARLAYDQIVNTIKH